MGSRLDVSFGFSGKLNPDMITHALGIIPTRIWHEGERDPISNFPRASGWEISTGILSGDKALNGYTAVASLISVLVPLAESIRNLRDILGAEVCLSIAVFLSPDDRDSTPSIGLTGDTLDFLARSGATVDIDTFLCKSELTSEPS
jgi:hypothetical protein